MVHTFEYYDPDNKVSLKGNFSRTSFKYAESPGKKEVVNKVIESERGISMAAQTLRSISQNEIIALQAMSEGKRLTDYVRDLNSAKNHAREKDRTEWLAEGGRIGREQFKSQMIEKMRAEGFTEEQIQLICGV